MRQGERGILTEGGATASIELTCPTDPVLSCVAVGEGSSGRSSIVADFDFNREVLIFARVVSARIGDTERASAYVIQAPMKCSFVTG
jgi:hypothetical protein